MALRSHDQFKASHWSTLLPYFGGAKPGGKWGPFFLLKSLSGGGGGDKKKFEKKEEEQIIKASLAAAKAAKAKIGFVLLSSSIERFFVSRMRDIYFSFLGES